MKNISRLFYALIISIVADGLVRRLAGASMASYLFFLKELIALAFMVCVFATYSARQARVLVGTALAATLILFPCVVVTASQDVFLAIFGWRQYSFFPWLAPATYLFFANQPPQALFKFFRFMSWILVLTALLAVVQLGLPADHWLNQTVTGDSMEEFMAGGYVRVKSSFPFVAQYTMFLNFAIAVVFYAVGNPDFGRSLKNILVNRWFVLIAYTIGIFATASRSAVLGAAFMGIVATLLLTIHGRWRAGLRVAAVGLVGVVAVTLIRDELPQVFAGYSERSAGYGGASHVQEVNERIFGMITNWYEEVEPTFFGHGIGIMSNGSDRVSGIAAEYRRGGNWTETDLANTYFEGGWYLLMTWMMFRVVVIAFVLTQLSGIANYRMFLVAAALGAFVTMQALSAPLGIHPPLAMWFWMAVGLMFVIRHHGSYGLAPSTGPSSRLGRETGKNALRSAPMRVEGPVMGPVGVRNRNG